ncbi:hypothetical protein BV20DRAFT_980626 [Pilatotrama ljubarskyi]|nr:hypothetical protein BV20DRAFT_980626 [Pilatotrama ljubarskyi]
MAVVQLQVYSGVSQAGSLLVFRVSALPRALLGSSLQVRLNALRSLATADKTSSCPDIWACQTRGHALPDGLHEGFLLSPRRVSATAAHPFRITFHPSCLRSPPRCPLPTIKHMRNTKLVLDGLTRHRVASSRVPRTSRLPFVLPGRAAAHNLAHSALSRVAPVNNILKRTARHTVVHAENIAQPILDALETAHDLMRQPLTDRADLIDPFELSAGDNAGFDCFFAFHWVLLYEYMQDGASVVQAAIGAHILGTTPTKATSSVPATTSTAKAGSMQRNEYLERGDSRSQMVLLAASHTARTGATSTRGASSPHSGGVQRSTWTSSECTLPTVPRRCLQYLDSALYITPPAARSRTLLAKLATQGGFEPAASLVVETKEFSFSEVP